MNPLRVLASLFLPQIRVRPAPSLYEGDPNQARLERPLPVHSQTQWLQSNIQDAIIEADSGNLMTAARLARSMRRDGTYAGLLASRAGGLTRLPKIFRGTTDVVRALEGDGEEVGLFDRVFSPKELELLDADGIVLGVGVGELLDIPGRQEPVFVRLDPEFLRYVWAEDRWYYQAYSGRVPVTPGDGRWILHTPGGFQQPWNGGLWPSLGRAYIAKEHAYLYRENYSGKLAHPARVAINPAGATDEHKLSFFKKVMAWSMNTVFGLPPGWDVKLLESNGRGYEIFKDTIAAADKEFMIGLAGQIVTTDGGAGFANADIHATIRSDLIQGDGFGLAQTINSQGLRPVINKMYGACERGIVAWDTRPPVDLAADANAIAAAAAALVQSNQALQSYGLRADAAEWVKRFKIPVYEVGKDLDAADASSAAVAELAQKMTEHAVERCEHGSPNRCRLCGVERVRDFSLGPSGTPAWKIAWRPIEQRPQTPNLRAVA